MVYYLLPLNFFLAESQYTVVPHSHQTSSYLRSGVDDSRFIGNDTAEELLTPLLRQLNFWCESGIRTRN